MHGQASNSSKHWLVAQCQGVFWIANAEVTTENAFKKIYMHMYVCMRHGVIEGFLLP